MQIEVRRVGGDHVLVIDGESVSGCQVRGDLQGYDIRISSESDARRQLLAMRLSEMPPEICALDFVLTYDWCEDLVAARFSRRHPDDVILAFDFYLADWHKPWSVQSYLRQLEEAVQGVGDRRLRWQEGDGVEFYGWGIVFRDAQQPSAILAERLQVAVDVIRPLERDVKEKLEIAARPDAIALHFRFPTEVRAACEQYLIYFGEFLRDLGVNVTTELLEREEHVLFSITPTDAPDALSRIRTALDVYLRLPGNSVLLSAEEDVPSQKLYANIKHLEGQLMLAKAVIHAQKASIDAQATTIVNQQVMLYSEMLAGNITSPDRETILAGSVSITPYEGPGFIVNLPTLVRRLRKLLRGWSA